MTLEKRIKNFKRHVAHVMGGFLIGVGMYYLFTFKLATEPLSMGLNFAMFVTLFLLGLSYLGE